MRLDEGLRPGRDPLRAVVRFTDPLLTGQQGRGCVGYAFGTDYKTLGGTVTIPAGALSRRIKIVPRPAGPRGTRTLKVIALPGPDYFVGAAVTARVILLAVGP